MLLPVFLLLTLAACPTASSHSQSQPESTSSDLHSTSPSPPERQSLAYYAEQLADERKKAMQRFEDYQRATAAWREEMAAAGEPVEDVDDGLAAPSSCLDAGVDDHVAAASFPWLEVIAVLFLLFVNCPAMRRRLLRLLKRGSEPDGVWQWLSRPSAASARAAPPSALKPPVDRDAGQTDTSVSRGMRELVHITLLWFDDGLGYVECKREGLERLPDGLPMETYRRRREGGRGYLDKTWAYVLDKYAGVEEDDALFQLIYVFMTALLAQLNTPHALGGMKNQPRLMEDTRARLSKWLERRKARTARYMRLAGGSPLCERCGLVAENASTRHCICKVLITPDDLDCLPLSLHALATLIFTTQ